MKKDVKVAKGRFAVIEINGELKRTIEATTAIRIEGGDNCEIANKTKSQLTGQELGAIKKSQ
jgi:hypothetical protein